jgi:hypothetical protein
VIGKPLQKTEPCEREGGALGSITEWVRWDAAGALVLRRNWSAIDAAVGLPNRNKKPDITPGVWWTICEI